MQWPWRIIQISLWSSEAEIPARKHSFTHNSIPAVSTKQAARCPTHSLYCDDTLYRPVGVCVLTGTTVFAVAREEKSERCGASDAEFPGHTHSFTHNSIPAAGRVSIKQATLCTHCAAATSSCSTGGSASVGSGASMARVSTLCVCTQGREASQASALGAGFNPSLSRSYVYVCARVFISANRGNIVCSGQGSSEAEIPAHTHSFTYNSIPAAGRVSTNQTTLCTHSSAAASSCGAATGGSAPVGSGASMARVSTLCVCEGFYIR